MKVKLVESKNIEGLTIEKFEDGSGSASLNGREFVDFDLATDEINFERKGWDRYTTESFGTLISFIEDYAVEVLGARRKNQNNLSV